MSSMTVSVVPASSVPNFACYPASSKCLRDRRVRRLRLRRSLQLDGSDASPAKTAAQQFEQYANMTPAQRLHAEMLAKLGLTEDQFKALPPAQQQKINDKSRR